MVSDSASQVVYLMGHGPSLNEKTLARFSSDITGNDTVVSFNHFWRNPFLALLEVSDVFFAVENKELEVGIARYADRIFPRSLNVYTPLPFERLGLLKFRENIRLTNHWRVIASSAETDLYLRGSREALPTQGLQALHYMLELGHRKFSLAGFDYYQGGRSYVYKSSRPKGYETPIHSLETDINYLLWMYERYNFSLKVYGGEDNRAWLKINSLVGSVFGGNRVLILDSKSKSSDWRV